jgi:hypothetical protein
MRGGSFRAGQQETWPARNLSCCPVFSSEDATPVSLPPTFDSATSESGTKISPSPAAVTSIARSAGDPADRVGVRDNAATSAWPASWTAAARW